MSFQAKFECNSSNHFSYDTAKIEASGSTLRLLDLGAGTYTTTNPYIECMFRFSMTFISGFAATKSTPATTEIKYQILVNQRAIYFNTTSGLWQYAANLDGVPLYTEANTEAQISANLPAIWADLGFAVNDSLWLGLRIFLHSDDGLARPTITDITFSGSMQYLSPATISECLITAYASDLLGDAYSYDSTKPMTLQVKNERAFMHGSKLIRPFTKTATFNSSGVAQLSVIETETPGEYLDFSIVYYEGPSKKQIRFNPAYVPNSATKTLNQIAQVRLSDAG